MINRSRLYTKNVSQFYIPNLNCHINYISRHLCFLVLLRKSFIYFFKIKRDLRDKKMKIKAIKILGMILLLSMAIPAVYAKGPTGKAGKSDTQQLYLVEKFPSGDWDTVVGGAWGKMTYNVASGDYVFNGHELVAEEDYTLINFARIDEQWPAAILILGTGIANGGGNVHIAGNQIFGDLGPDGTTESVPGIKIWLVLTDDLTGSTLSEWTPEDYLFEEDTIPELVP